MVYGEQQDLRAVHAAHSTGASTGPTTPPPPSKALASPRNASKAVRGGLNAPTAIPCRSGSTSEGEIGGEKQTLKHLGELLSPENFRTSPHFLKPNPNPQPPNS